MDNMKCRTLGACLVMNELQSRAYLSGNKSSQPRLGQLAASFGQRQQGAQVFPIDQLQGDVARLSDITVIQDSHNTRVAHRYGDAGFLVEETPETLVPGKLRQDPFDNDGPFAAVSGKEQGVENLSCSADSDAIQQFVTAGESLVHSLSPEEGRGYCTSKSGNAEQRLGLKDLRSTHYRVRGLRIPFLLLLLSLGLAQARPVAAAPDALDPLAVLLAGPSCPDALVTAQIEKGLRRNAKHKLPDFKVGAALTRARAMRSLVLARRLFTRANFPGCISLLSITEQEMGRNLTDDEPAFLERSHRLLAAVNLWLGICQWAAGDPQTAAASFVRSAQLPSRPAPDPNLLPPALIKAYREAIAAPRPDVMCKVDPPIRVAQLQIDGRRPLSAGSEFRVSVGTHYLALTVRCPSTSPGEECRALQEQRDGQGIRSFRLEATSLHCHVELPVAIPSTNITCATLSEARDAKFVASLTKEAGAGGTLVVSLTERRIELGLCPVARTTDSSPPARAAFSRQLVAQLDQQETPSRVVARSLDLLLSREPRPGVKPAMSSWYEKWWIWALLGAGVAVTTTAAVVATRSDNIKVVFGP